MEKSLSRTYTPILHRVVDTSWRYPSHQRRTVRCRSKFVRQDQIQKAWSYWPLPQSLRSATSQLFLWLPTQWHLRRGRAVSTFIDTLMRDAGTASTSELSACMENKADLAAQGDTVARLRQPEWMNEWMNECMYESEWMNEWMNACMHACINECMNEWMNERMNESMDCTPKK